MAKLIIKMVLMVGVFLGISNYMLYVMTGKSPFSGLKLPSFSRPNLDVGTTFNKTINNGKQQAFKWTDDKGVVHYSSEAPINTSSVETIEVDPNTNLIQGLNSRTEQEEAKAEPEVMKKNVYSPGGAKKFLDEAKNVEKILKERETKRKQTLDNI